MSVISSNHILCQFWLTSSVSFETFAKVTALERRDLSYNNKRTVDINILTELQKCPRFNHKINRYIVTVAAASVAVSKSGNIERSSGETTPKCDTLSKAWHIDCLV